MVAPREVVQTTPQPWLDAAAAGVNPPAAGAWLLGYVRTAAPGYREVLSGSTLYVVPSAEYRFDALVTALNTTGFAVSWENWGSVLGAGPPATWPDRLGWLLGRGTEAGDYEFDPGTYRFVPPAGIPLIGATWTQVVDDADRRQLLDRHRRNQGYVWGSALLWRCKLVMHRYALEALQTGWCLRGKVTLGCADMLDTPISSTEPRGAITGYALGLDSVSWLDSIQQNARVEMTIVTA